MIGLGRFGSSLALELEANGVQVLGIDTDPTYVDQLADQLTHVVVADSTSEEALRQLGIADFERAVVCIGTDLEASILTASILLELGVKEVWAKAMTIAHARILTKLGVPHVVRPEHDMGRRVAHLVSGRMLDYIEFDDGYAIVKTRPPREIWDQPLGESQVRSLYGVTIVGVKRRGEGFTHATAETVVHQGDLIIVSGPRTGVEKFSNLS